MIMEALCIIDIFATCLYHVTTETDTIAIYCQDGRGIEVDFISH